MDDDQLLEAYLNTLESSEGVEGGDTVTGLATRPYGVKDLLGVNEEDYPDNPRGLAKAVARKNIDELKRMGVDWDNLPTSMKFNALDIQFNMGSLNVKAPKYFEALKDNNYQEAIKQSLDAIGAYDPKRKGERPSKGIAIRRAKFYNMVAEELEYPKITNVNAVNLKNQNKSAEIVYTIPGGENIPIRYQTLSLHSTTKPGSFKIGETYNVTARPVQPDVDIQEGQVPEGFKEVSPVTNAEGQYTLDYAGELPDIGSDVEPMEESTDNSMGAEGTDEESAISKILRGESATQDIQSKADEFPEQKSWLQRLLGYAEGGVAMQRQMEMFEDGGLMDEGGSVDPISGNEVPPGSTQEEVRDDIPAQLSEGEFVFPADVVRYWGLEKLMQMRQEAKAGLARMEDMGQMGNSDEATLPDDIPFDLEDLDMEEEGDYNMAVGGYIPNQFGVYQQPSQFTGYVAPQYQPPTSPAVQPVSQQPLQTGFTPVTTPIQPTAPKFQDLIPTTEGKYDELKQYENKETGQTMTIPFVGGNPVYPIPTGFTEVATDVIEPTETPEVTTPTATVTAQGGGERDIQGPEYSTTDVTGIGYDRSKLSPSLQEAVSEYGFGFGALTETMGKAGVMGIISSLTGKDKKASPNVMTSSAFGGVLDSFRGGDVSFSSSVAKSGLKTGNYSNTTPLHELSTVTQIEIASTAKQVVGELQKAFLDEKGKPVSEEQANKNINAIASNLGISTTIPGTNVSKNMTTILREIGKVRSDQIQAEKEAARKAEIAAAQASYEKAVKEDQGPSYEGGQETIGQAVAEGRDPTGTAGAFSGGPTGMSDWGDYKGAFVGESYIAKKGLVNKKPKPKKMKRGGLASKK